MNSTELRDAFRSDVVDQVEPFLWSETEVYDYADDAQKMFCRLTGGLGDATSALTVLEYSTVTDWLATSALILKIRAANNAADGFAVEVINFEDMATHGIRFDGRIGRTKYLVIGMEANKARLYPFPVSTGAIQLIVDRLPLKPINDADQKLEVSEHHKVGLGLWMKARAYGKQDAETFDRGRAADYTERFIAYCSAATREKDRAKHKTRVVAYGGL